jgi:putative transposase
LLRKERFDRGESHLPETVNSIIDTAISKIYLTAERQNAAAVIEEVRLQCFKAKIERPGDSTVRRRIALLSDRIKVEKRKGNATT